MLRFEDLPKGGYTLQLSNLPQHFNEACIKTYTENKNATKHFTRGYVFFNSQHVQKILLNYTDVIFVKGEVKASFDGKIIYPCFAVLEKDGTVRGGQCKCKSGSGGVCSHVCALLWCVLDSKNSGKNYLQLKNFACTEQPQSWGHGAKTSHTAEFFDLLFIKHNPFNKNNRSRKNNENRRKKRLNLNVNVTPKILQDMHDRLTKANINSVLCKSLECNDFQPNISVPVQENQCVVDAELPINVPNICLWESDLASVMQNETTPFQYETVSMESCWDIEKRTRNQSDCKEWQEERGKALVTASKFHNIVNRKKAVTPAFLRAIFGEKYTDSGEQQNEQTAKKTKFSGTLYTRLGLLNEEVACSKYASAKSENEPNNEEKGVLIYKCGLVINPGVPFLGASPDRVVFDKEKQEYGLLEIKTLSKAKTLNLTLHEAITMKLAKNLLIRNGEIKLKKNSEFYTQMQGQMALTGLQFCDLIVDSGKEFYIERFTFNEYYWKNTMLPKLTKFCVEYHPRDK